MRVKPAIRAGLRRCACLLLGWAMLAFPALALDPEKPFQDYVLDTWGVEQGLPQISVLTIAQDPAGYLWFGTQAGLARFDGVRFQRYTQNDAPALGSTIQALLADQRQRLWIGTTRGVLVLENGRFRTLATGSTTDAPERVFPANALALDGEQVLVAGVDGIYTPDGNHLRRLYTLPGPVLSLQVRADGLWAGGHGRVFRIRDGQVKQYPLPGPAQDVPVTHLAQTGDMLWAGTRLGLYRLQQGNWQAVGGRTGDATGAVEALASDRDGNLWLATPLYLERLREGRPPERVQNTAGSIAVRSIFEDHDGNLWLGSMIEGVTRAWNGRSRRLSQNEGLGNPLLWSLAAAPDGSVWVGSSSGVDRWQGERFQPRADGARLPHPEAYSLLPEQDRTWIGTRAGAAVLRDGHLEVPAVLAPLRDAQVNGILRDHAGRLWFATTKGLFLLQGEDRLTRYTEQDGMTDARIRLVHETRDGRILLGTYQGLYEWRDGRILATGRDTGLPDDGVAPTALLELEDGRWVLGSSTGSNLRIHDGTRWHALDSRHSLPMNVPFYMAQNGGDLWVAGMQGIYRLPLASLDNTLADPAQPLAAQMVINSGSDHAGGQQGKCCNGSGNSRGLLRDGKLWLPTRDGVLLVDVDMPPDDGGRKLRIEGLHVQGSWLRPGQGRLRLPLDARDLRIEFSLPSFQPMHTPQLRYRLVGYDAGWRELDSAATRIASYTNLPPGQYTFEVADFSREDRQASAAQLSLELPRHLYETLAFRLLAVLVLVALVWLGYLGLRHRYARQRAHLERLVQERTQDLQAANARLEAISFTDELTGLHNRRYLARQIPTDLAFYERDESYHSGSQAVVFALLDVDHFKAINDTHGHAAGDRVLEQLGQLLGELKRGGDYVARWGGEEFLLVFRPRPRHDLAAIGQRLCTSIAAHTFELGNGHTHRLTVSVGLVECPLFPGRPHLLRWEQLVTLADRALYRAKTCGRNGWVAYRPLPGMQPPEELKVIEGDPWWLVERGYLEMFGSNGSLHSEPEAVPAV